MFKDNLKMLREQSSLTQQQLANIINVSYKTISHYETGVSEPSIAIIIKLKKFFNCDYEELLE